MKSAFSPKGRQASPSDLTLIGELIGPDIQQRDLLIEHLHKIQDQFGWLSQDHLCALAELMKLSQAEVFEVASFYAHFRFDPPETLSKACKGIVCQMKRNAPVTDGAPCVGACYHAPVDFKLGHVHDHPTIKPMGAYDTLHKIKQDNAPIQHLLDELQTADLRGMGGAGFPVARKMAFLREQTAAPVLVINADEGEPGTFKDRHCLETDPHKVMEGAFLAAHIIGATDIYLYLRDEYTAIRHMLEIEFPKIQAAPFAANITLHLRRGAGAYICGEETALLESLEGKRGLPRIKPPYPAQSGLFNRPTLVHNVETLWRVQEILTDGADAYLHRGRPRFYSLSGHINNPGVYEARDGITINELIETFGGGMASGHRFKAYMPGGASGGILPAHMADLPLSFGVLEQYGCFIGSAAVVILSDQDNMRDVCLHLMEFFDHESCGQCTPCRVGCEKMASLLQGPSDTDLIRELGAVMRDASICGLGQAAPNPVLSAMTYFPEDFS